MFLGELKKDIEHVNHEEPSQETSTTKEEGIGSLGCSWPDSAEEENIVADGVQELKAHPNCRRAGLLPSRHAFQVGRADTRPSQFIVANLRKARAQHVSASSKVRDTYGEALSKALEYLSEGWCCRKLFR